MQKMKFIVSGLAMSAFVFFSCGNDDEPDTPSPTQSSISISSINATGTSFTDGSDVNKDLNGASSATDVALNSTIAITLDSDVDAASATTSSVSLSNTTSAVTVSGSTITLTPEGDLDRGTSYTLTLNGVKGSNGATLSQTTRTFTTEGRAAVTVPNESAMIAYWNFDNNPDEATGTYTSDNVVSITYGEDRFGQGASVASFDGDESIIEVGNATSLMDSDDFTISFWVKSDSVGHINQNGDPSNHFVLGLAANAGFQFEMGGRGDNCKLAMSYAIEGQDPQSEDLFYNGTGLTETSWQGWDFSQDISGSGGLEGLILNKWAHILCTYDATAKTGKMFINGQLMKSQDFNLWPEAAPKRNVTGVAYSGTEPDFEPILAFGFIKSIDSERWAETPWGNYAVPTSNHFKGSLDDVRIFNTSFSAADVTTLYDSEK